MFVYPIKPGVNAFLSNVIHDIVHIDDEETSIEGTIFLR